MFRRLVCVTVLGLPLAACELPNTGTDPLSEVPTLRIADAAHNGDQHFYFLPPLAWQPEYSGDFDAAADPEVTVCAQNGNGCDGLVTYNTTSEAFGSSVRANPENEFFLVNWHTDQFALEVNTVYRIGVRVGGVEVGYLDVLLVDNKSGLRSGGRNDIVPLVNGRTAPIKFRIEQGLGGTNEPEPPTEPDPPEPPAIPENAITGAVTNNVGTGIEGISVSAVAGGVVVSDTVTNADGSYVLPWPDGYTEGVVVRFEDTDKYVYQGECYDNAPLMFGCPNPTLVGPGSSSIDAVLDPK